MARKKIRYYTIEQLYVKKLEERVPSRPLSSLERFLTYLALFILLAVVVFAIFTAAEI